MTVDDVRRLIDLDRASLEASGVTALYVFGSIARGEARRNSDVDVIVDYDPTSAFDLVDLADVQQRLTARLAAKVDVVTRKGLHRRIRENVLREARTRFVMAKRRAPLALYHIRDANRGLSHYRRRRDGRTDCG